MFPACVGGDFTDFLSCRNAGLQLCKQRLSIIGVNGNQQATCRLGVIQQILQMERYIALVHMGFCKIAVTVHALGQDAYAGKFCGLIQEAETVHMEMQLHITALCHLGTVT